MLYSFTGGRDGAFPNGGLITDSAGNFYGTTSGGGRQGNGTVFKLSPVRPVKVLYSFTGGSDGVSPNGGLIADSAGNLYGTTSRGGGPGCGGSGCGVVFKVSPDGTERVLYAFTGGSDGAFPKGSLIADGSRNLYGTASAGGRPRCPAPYGKYGCGVVFRLSPPATPGGAWTEKVLYAFRGSSDGASPIGSLIADSAGNLYGTTYSGGRPVCPTSYGCGVVFKLSPGGIYSVLHVFTFDDGANPTATLIADAGGSLYGTANNGGVQLCFTPSCTARPGVVFKLSPGRIYTVLHAFTMDDGAHPAGLIADSAGNLYGTTVEGGSPRRGASCEFFGCGVAFKLTGTGFIPPAVPFSAINATLAIQFGQTPNTDAFELSTAFTLGENSSGINPSAEPVTLQIGTFTAAIPPGSFQQRAIGAFSFTGVVNGVDLEIEIAPKDSRGRYGLNATAQKANLARTLNPVPVTLTIGANTGTVSVNAHIGHLAFKLRSWAYRLGSRHTLTRGMGPNSAASHNQATTERPRPTAAWPVKYTVMMVTSVRTLAGDTGESRSAFDWLNIEPADQVSPLEGATVPAPLPSV